MDRFVHDTYIKYVDYINGKGNKVNERYHFLISFIDGTQLLFSCRYYEPTIQGRIFYDYREEK